MANHVGLLQALVDFADFGLKNLLVLLMKLWHFLIPDCWFWCIHMAEWRDCCGYNVNKNNTAKEIGQLTHQFKILDNFVISWRLHSFLPGIGTHLVRPTEHVGHSIHHVE